MRHLPAPPVRGGAPLSALLIAATSGPAPSVAGDTGVERMVQACR